ncbi:alpha/beta fold hydrolase [Serratia ficaria]|uniref:3-oxoadipate enol-lactonase n=1 Tax=Serratia ficaria TaxID=61651 RepID=A0A240ALM0_SERFI|nr:alpha/beta hydrolase [Serratia ficaria]REF42013.1 rhamnosyltransferase subunit A [Serratia ficaria]CAI0941032.1 3-oxoadipate enol-lactonase [Serratia ficaria]CAI0957046.1 3-oxoadipate enol-lactonase [Serratia ficaria]CAI1039881.1 3-oxoadipate enol-lactonase [Serratia ficaria]CAI2063535.1 3-oxoadipate enol-lactonase [Serratia ficaria]
MKPETEIIKVGQWQIYVERYIYPNISDTVICVNGALSTTLAFRNCVKNFKNRVNVILFDLPFIGNSRPHNMLALPLPKTEEVFILQSLINIYRPDYILSVSWGGLAALMTLSTRPSSIRKAIIASFSTRITPAMHSYINRARVLLDEGKNHEVATLLNDEVGKYLPTLLKKANHQHIKNLDHETYRQASFHIGQISSLCQEDYIDIFRQIETPILFINGEMDEYTTAEDIRDIRNYITNCDFITIPETGHFLDMESRPAAQRINELLNSYFFVEKAMAS